MKFLKIKLADNKIYTLSTFTVNETKHLQREYRKYQKSEDESNMIRFETDDEGKLKLDKDGNWILRSRLTEAQEKRLENIEDEGFEFMIDIFRKSICKRHPEFKKIDEDEDDRKIKEELMNLIDFPELRKIVSFAFNGTYLKEEDTIEVNFGDEDGGKK